MREDSSRSSPGQEWSTSFAGLWSERSEGERRHERDDHNTAQSEFQIDVFGVQYRFKVEGHWKIRSSGRFQGHLDTKEINTKKDTHSQNKHKSRNQD